MMEVAMLAIGLVIGLAVGAAAATLLARRAIRAARTGQAQAQAREAAVAVAVSKLGHDLRGALSPGLLMAEHLEGNADPAVKRAATVIAQALDRAAELTRTASTLAKAGRLAETPPQA
jgi:signal transduction histidine kinase